MPLKVIEKQPKNYCEFLCVIIENFLRGSKSARECLIPIFGIVISQNSN